MNSMRYRYLPPFVIVVAIAAALFGGFQSKDDDIASDKLLTFGTWVDVQVAGAGHLDTNTLFANLGREFALMNDRWHAWQPSTVTSINQKLRLGKPFEADADIIELLKLNKSYYEKTHGLFNSALGELFQTWGFYSDAPQLSQWPHASSINTITANPPGYDHILIEQNRVTGHHPRLQLDFGGIAKGYGLKTITAMLKKSGINNALINAGGDIVGFGQRNKMPWKVAIKHPTGQDVLGFIEIYGEESIFTSGTYERRYELNGQIVHHIIDPRSGYPSQGVKAVTVITKDPVVADVAATTLVIAGPKQWEKTAKQLGVDAVLLVTDNDQVILSPAMKQRLITP